MLIAAQYCWAALTPLLPARTHASQGDPGNCTCNTTVGPPGPAGPPGVRQQRLIMVSHVAHASLPPVLFQHVSCSLPSCLCARVCAYPAGNCTTPFAGNETRAAITIGSAGPSNKTFSLTVPASTSCPGGNATLLTGGCELRCDRDEDYSRVFLTKQLVIPGTAIVGTNASVECAARWGSATATVNAGDCFLIANAFCC